MCNAILLAHLTLQFFMKVNELIIKNYKYIDLIFFMLQLKSFLFGVVTARFVHTLRLCTTPLLEGRARSSSL